MCLFQGSVGTGVQVLSVSHKGIKLLKMVRSSSAVPDYFRVLRPYRWACGIFPPLDAFMSYNCNFNLKNLTRSVFPLIAVRKVSQVTFYILWGVTVVWQAPFSLCPVDLLVFHITSCAATRTSCLCRSRPRTCWSSTWPTRSWSCSRPRPRRSNTWSTTSSRSLRRWASLWHYPGYLSRDTEDIKQLFSGQVFIYKIGRVHFSFLF